MNTDKNIYDLTIIGGGPAGLFAAFYAGLREMKVKIIETQDRLGGKVHVYPEKMIWDVGGLTPVSGMTLIKQMVEQGLTFNPTVAINETVQSVEKDKLGTFHIQTNKDMHYSKAVLLAIGSGIVDPIKLELTNAHQFETGNLYYSVKRMKDFEGKRIVISGGGNAAVDWANALAPIAEQVTLIYRGQMLKGHEKEVSRLVENHVQYDTNTEITKLIGEANQIQQVRLRNNQTNVTKLLEVDAVIINHGYNRNQRFMREWNLDVRLKDGYFIEGNAFGESTQAGLYAAGDILHYDGKLKLIAGAFQDAVNAVNSAKQLIEPDAIEFARVSSHHDAFKEKNKQYIYQ